MRWVGDPGAVVHPATTLHKHGGRRNNFKFKLSQVYYRCHLKSQKLPPADWSVGVWGERGAHGFVARAASAPGRTTRRSREVGRRGGANKRWGTHASGRPSRSVSRLLLAGWAAAAQATLTARTTTRSLEGEGMGVQWFVVLKVETADFDWFRVDYLEPAKVGTGPPAGSLEPCPCSAAGPGPLSALLVAQLPVRTGHSSLARERNWCRRSFNRHWSGSANVSLGSTSTTSAGKSSMGGKRQCV